MIRFWSGGTVDFSYTVTSTAAKLEFSPGAIEVCDRGGVPHRIETNQPPIPIRLTLDIYENVLALENSEDIRLDDFLIGVFKGGIEITLMESTRNKAYKCFIESLDERIAAGRDRMMHRNA